MIKRVVVPYGMEWLRVRLRLIGKTGASLARHLGIPRERVYEMFKGTRRLQQEEIGPTARYLEWTEAELVAHIEGRSGHTPSAATAAQQFKNAQEPYADITLTPLVQYRTIPRGIAQRGDFMIIAERIDEVPRPFFLKFSEKAFSIRVLDDKMHPAYKRWDIVLVDPDGPAIDGENCLFTGDIATSDGSLSVLGCLKSSTATVWIVHHYGTKKDHELPKADFPNAWPIVACYHRR